MVTPPIPRFILLKVRFVYRGNKLPENRLVPQSFRVKVLNRARCRCLFCLRLRSRRAAHAHASQIRHFLSVPSLPAHYVCPHPAGGRIIIITRSLPLISEQHPVRLLHRRGGSRIFLNIVVDLIGCRVVHMRAKLRDARPQNIAVRIGSGAHCLRLQRLLRIGRRHLAGHHGIEIFLQRQFID